jgi:hypothetical protein
MQEITINNETYLLIKKEAYFKQNNNIDAKGNTGDWNTGHRNTGDWNTGDE